jgi:hypothetical protein
MISITDHSHPNTNTEHGITRSGESETRRTLNPVSVEPRGLLKILIISLYSSATSHSSAFHRHSLIPVRYTAHRRSPLTYGFTSSFVPGSRGYGGNRQDYRVLATLWNLLLAS